MVTLVDALIQMKSSYIAPTGFKYNKECTYVATCSRLYADDDKADDEAIIKSFERVIAKIRENPSVERLSIYSPSYRDEYMVKKKGTRYNEFAMVIEADSDFFEIFRPKFLNGTDIYNDTFKQNWSRKSEIKPIIISTKVADNNFFIDTLIDGRPKYKKNNDYNKLIGTIYESNNNNQKVTNRYKIMGVVEKTAFANPVSNLNIIYTPFNNRDNYAANSPEIQIIIKTKGEATLSKESIKLDDNTLHNIDDIELFDDYIFKYMLRGEFTGIIYNFTLISLFFIFNLILGVFGSFWYRTVQRKSEIGLQMAIGATPKMIFRELFCEAIILLSIAFVPAFIIAANQFYFNAALLRINNEAMSVGRFLIDVLYTYLTMMILIFIAITPPAIKAIRSNPSVALNSDK